MVHRAVANATGTDLRRVRSGFLERVSMSILKANARATFRRDPNGAIAAQRGPNAAARQARLALASTGGLQPPPEVPEELDGAT